MKRWCKCAHAWLFMYVETCQSCATAEPQWGSGQEPWSPAAWQAVLALGWPLPPLCCPHSLTSLGWQQQPNKLRAPRSSHHSKGMFFTAPPKRFMVIMFCVVHKHPNVKCNLPKLAFNEKSYTSMYFTSTWLPPYPYKIINIMGVDLVLFWVKNAWIFWYQDLPVCAEKVTKNLGKLFEPALQYVTLKHRILTDEFFIMT